jgi:hypothetical protein
VAVATRELAAAERDILAGVPGATKAAMRFRQIIEMFSQEPPLAPPLEPELTAKEYFEKYGMAAAGRGYVQNSPTRGGLAPGCYEAIRDAPHTW